jgi:hypothetical protein
MSLKAFHILFIGVSTVLCFGFGIWLFLPHQVAPGAFSILGGVLSIAAGGGLILYGRRFLEKLKHVSYL